MSTHDSTLTEVQLIRRVAQGDHAAFGLLYPGDVNLTDDAGRTPLHLAATHCHDDAAKLLLDKGAKIDAKATGGTTPLDFAAQAECVDMVDLLISKGAKVNARDDQGRTPLDQAMQWHRDEVVQLLRAHGGIE